MGHRTVDQAVALSMECRVWGSHSSHCAMRKNRSKMVGTHIYSGHRLRVWTSQRKGSPESWISLEEYHVNWLLIIDNVDRSTLDFLRLHCPREGNILFTTRTVDVALALVNMTRTPHCMLKLQTLNQDDTTNLLFKDAGIGLEFVTPSRLNNAKLLVEAVGRLPLAVVQAASFMRETHTTLDEMLELYNSEEKIEVGTR